MRIKDQHAEIELHLNKLSIAWGQILFSGRQLDKSINQLNSFIQNVSWFKRKINSVDYSLLNCELILNECSGINNFMQTHTLSLYKQSQIHLISEEELKEKLASALTYFETLDLELNRLSEQLEGCLKKNFETFLEAHPKEFEKGNELITPLSHMCEVKDSVREISHVLNSLKETAKNELTLLNHIYV